MALEDNKHVHLEELGGSDFEIADGEPNIKGWDVKDHQGHLIGQVEELLFNPETRMVRYLVLDLDSNELNLEKKKVLLPVEVAVLHDNDDAVILQNLRLEQLSKLPTYNNSGNIDQDTETHLHTVFNDSGIEEAGEHSSQNFNEGHKLLVIEDHLEVGKREVETGKAWISSRLVEKPVKEKINLREEHVNVERKPVNKPLSEVENNKIFEEEEFEITEHAEIPVVSKEARVVEEVSIQKEVEEREINIRETLRNTEVEAEHLEDRKKRL